VIWHSHGTDCEERCLWGLYTINVYQAKQHHIAKDSNLNKEKFASMVGCFEEAV
jgi:hypothetical protein